MLASSCVTACCALSQSVSLVEKCGLKLGLSDGQAMFRSVRSDLITSVVSYLQNISVYIKVSG